MHLGPDQTQDDGSGVCVIRAGASPVDHLQPFLDGFYGAAREVGLPLVSAPGGGLWRRLGSACGRLGIARALPGIERRAICPVAWASDRDAFPLQLAYRLIPWVYDCWEPDFPRWDRLLLRLRPPVAFFSCRRVADRFADRLPDTVCHWVPEAVDCKAYSPGQDLAARCIGVLEVGRRWGEFSRRFGPALERCGISSLRSDAATAPTAIPSDRFRDVLASTRLLVCYPKSITHPDAAGSVETVTYRYFEGMASRCLLVGHCPAELRELWGYDPVIEVNLNTDPRHLVEIATDPSRHQALVDRNYARLREVGLWRHRLEFMARHAR